MGRPPLGRSARTVPLTTKASEAERDALVGRYGSVYMGLRVGIRLALGQTVPTDNAFSAKGKVTEIGVSPIPEVVETKFLPKGAVKLPKVGVPDVVKMPSVPGPHHHRRGKELDPIYKQGAKVRQYVCAINGCGEVLS